MRILVYPHDLGIGGSQLNAIELASAVRSLGHDVLIFGRRGPLVKRISELGLEFIEAPDMRVRPSPSAILALRHLVEARSIDILHAYEWPPIMNAWLAVLGTRAVATSTVMSMSVAPFIPKWIPMVVGTEGIAALERQRGRSSVTVIEPPVDLEENDPNRWSDHRRIRSSLGLDPESFAVVTVTRLARELKLEGILAAVDVVPRLASNTQLLVVGDGASRAEVERRADQVNRAAGRRAVVLTGELVDPRPAYAVADVVLGMGGSALRAMSFGKPLVVQGERGFWRALDEQSLGQFLWDGWYGIGTAKAVGVDALARELRRLLVDRSEREHLGALGRRLVEDRFSLERAACRQLAQYDRARAEPARSLGHRPEETLRLASQYLKYASKRKLIRLRGRRGTDDFNEASLIGSLGKRQLRRIENREEM